MNTSIVNAMWFISGIIFGWIVCWLTRKIDEHPKKESEVINIKPDDKPKSKTKKKGKKKKRTTQELLNEVIKEDNDRKKIDIDMNRSEETQQTLED